MKGCSGDYQSPRTQRDDPFVLTQKDRPRVFEKTE